MKAAYINKRPEIGHLPTEFKIDHNQPKPSPEAILAHEVLVKVKASSINIDDIHAGEGTFCGGIAILQTKKPSIETPLILGSDFAGEVVAVGKKVKDVKVGDRICGCNAQVYFHEPGTWAEFTITYADHFITIPEFVPYSEAAALVYPLFVNAKMLRLAEPKDSDRVLVIGASGGIGSVLIQVLRKVHPGIHIIAVCSGKNASFVKSLGANDVIDYTLTPIEDALDHGSLDTIFDYVGGDQFRKTQVLLHRKGRFVTATGPVKWIGDKKLSIWEQISCIGAILWNQMLNLIPGSRPYYYMAAPLSLEKELFEMVFSNQIHPAVERTIKFTTTELSEAMSVVQSHRSRGRHVIEF